MKYGHNRFRNRYDYESRKSYRRQRNSDDNSDSSSNHYSANNSLLKEFIDIKKFKDKIPFNIENKDFNFNAKEKHFNCNNFNDPQNNNNEYFMDIEQPTQIFSALRKPNFN